MPELAQERKAPAVFFVPPPSNNTRIFKSARGPVTFGIICVAIALLVILIGGSDYISSTLHVLGVLLLITLFLVYLDRWSSKEHSKALHNFQQERGSLALNPITERLHEAWGTDSSSPKIDKVWKAVREAGPLLPRDRANVICYGFGSVPDVGEYYFEPEIVTPTGIVWRRLFFLPVAFFLVTWITLGRTGLLPSAIPSLSLSSGYVVYPLGSAVVAVCVWFWSGMVNPTYIRFAPGIIQVLKYRPFHSKPTITSFEMNSGTMAIVVTAGQHFTITLANETNSHTAKLYSFRHAKRVTEQAWRAMLSTAPIPPLSDEDLVG